MAISKKSINERARDDRFDMLVIAVGSFAFIGLFYSLGIFTFIISLGADIEDVGMPKLILSPLVTLALMTSLDLILRRKKGVTIALLISYVLFTALSISAPRDAISDEWPLVVIKIVGATGMLYYYLKGRECVIGEKRQGRRGERNKILAIILMPITVGLLVFMVSWAEIASRPEDPFQTNPKEWLAESIVDYEFFIGDGEVVYKEVFYSSSRRSSAGYFMANIPPEKIPTLLETKIFDSCDFEELYVCNDPIWFKPDRDKHSRVGAFAYVVNFEPDEYCAEINFSPKWINEGVTPDSTEAACINTSTGEFRYSSGSISH